MSIKTKTGHLSQEMSRTSDNNVKLANPTFGRRASMRSTTNFIPAKIATSQRGV
jgi:hypothetical protein